MCGIFGLIVNDHSDLTKKNYKKALHLIFKLSEPRGRDASGLAIAFNKKISIYKQAIKSSAMLKSKKLNQFLDSHISRMFLNETSRISAPVAIIGHTRLVTNGSQAIQGNNHPLYINHLVGIHNGIIANDKDLLISNPEIKLSSGINSHSDSEVLFGLIAKYYEHEDDMITAISKCYEKISGSASIALFADNCPALTLATNTGSLYYSYKKENGFFVFGSERYIVERFLQKSVLLKEADSSPVSCLKPSTGMQVLFENIEPDIFSFGLVSKKPGRLWNFNEKELYKITDESSFLMELKRCANCVLPETYPFISFDQEGVCNYCRKYKKQKFHGYKALEEVLGKYRSKSGEPDCIVGFSGGRDSSYALHVLKKEFGMNPIAYTYDWAMVTDISRRNQAKVTGKLGIEHLIRAADIHKKRRYIRKNIYAWLKKPELGMVPLFMAGDKMFYYYGRQLRKETGIKLTIFAAGQQLEQMEFKVGFCGINQRLENNTKLYHFDLISKIQLAWWYAKQYVINPRYLNESVFDSIFAYYASFINKDDYLYLYRYIPWDERLIEQTIKEHYGWESDKRYGENQWRMGDGHTAFINFIYFTIAGFSEFDNFRSNQIREGLITRQKALECLIADNKPKIDMLQDFSQLIGFNLEEVLLKINEIPKLYNYTS